MCMSYILGHLMVIIGVPLFFFCVYKASTVEKTLEKNMVENISFEKENEDDLKDVIKKKNYKIVTIPDVDLHEVNSLEQPSF